jgi:hypothetical protein
MITLIELFDAAILPMLDLETKEKVDSKVVLKHPNAIVEKISCDEDFNILVKYAKEPEDADD